MRGQNQWIHIHTSLLLSSIVFFLADSVHALGEINHMGGGCICCYGHSSDKNKQRINTVPKVWFGFLLGETSLINHACQSLATPSGAVHCPRDGNGRWAGSGTPAGTPTKSQLYHRFEELHPRLNALNWHLPDAGLVGRVWEKASSRCVECGVFVVHGLCMVRPHIIWMPMESPTIKICL